MLGIWSCSTVLNLTHRYSKNQQRRHHHLFPLQRRHWCHLLKMDKDLAIFQLIEGENFPEGGSLVFTVVWGRESAKLKEIPSLSKMGIFQEAAFQVMKNDQRIFKQKQLYLKCIHTNAAGVKRNLGIADVLLDPNVSLFKKWYTFTNKLNNNNEEPMPSVLVSTFFESSVEERPNEEPSTSHLPTQCQQGPSPDAAVSSTVADSLIPILVNDDYFLIGTAVEGERQSFYTISIILSFAENLLALFPSRSLWPLGNMPFEFQFQLLGHPIIMEWDLKNMLQIGERATAKILCTPAVLLRYLKEVMPVFHIYLCYEDIVISETAVPILQRIEGDNLEQKILQGLDLDWHISDIFPMRSLLEASRTNMDTYSTTMQPQMGVQILISKVVEKAVCQSPLITSSGLPCNDSPVKFSSPNRHASNREPSCSFPAADPGLNKRQSDLLYATALELEVWKEGEKLAEQERQDRDKSSYLQLLNQEYFRQVSVKEVAFERRLRRIEELEEQLKAAIQDTRQSEIEFKREKEKLSRQQAQLSKERSLVSTEVERERQRLLKKHEFALKAERLRHEEIVQELRRQLTKYRANSAPTGTKP